MEKDTVGYRAFNLKTIVGGEVMSQAVAAYRGITATEEFKHLEILRARAGHDEAQALNNARRQEREKWQGVVAQKDTALASEKAENEKLRQQITLLQSNRNS